MNSVERSLNASALRPLDDEPLGELNFFDVLFWNCTYKKSRYCWEPLEVVDFFDVLVDNNDSDKNERIFILDFNIQF